MQKLSRVERSALASNAAKARWAKKETKELKDDAGIEPSRVNLIPKALYSGTLKLGSSDIPVYVLSNGQKVLARIAATEALTGVKRQGDLSNALVAAGLCIATVIKRTEKKRVVAITRMVVLGSIERARTLLTRTGGCLEFNTSLIERFNGTMRERLASLTRKCRHAAQRIETLETGMYLIGCTYNLCWPHHELSCRKHFGYPCTPAMAAGLTDHIWSVAEVLSYKRAPAPWGAPKRRGRPPKEPIPDQIVPKRPQG